MQALDLLNQGKLDEAIDAAIESVRNEPGNSGAREILAELFCLRGDLERADKQADTIVVQQPQSAMTAALLRQLIRAETSRRECWNDGRVPEFIGEPDEACKQTLAALVAMRTGNHEEAASILEQVDEQSSNLSGNCNGKSFDTFRDLDDCCTAIIEVCTSTGKYFWVPASRVHLAEFAPVSRPRDLVWRQCELTVDDGPTGVVYLPALYINSETSDDVAQRLGRATNWIENDGEPVRGRGQRTFLIGEEEVGIMEMQTLGISSPS